jgi:hypothetical protein
MRKGYAGPWLDAYLEQAEAVFGAPTPQTRKTFNSQQPKLGLPTTLNAQGFSFVRSLNVGS